jgi:hypothetical protein
MFPVCFFVCSQEEEEDPSFSVFFKNNNNGQVMPTRTFQRLGLEAVIGFSPGDPIQGTEMSQSQGKRNKIAITEYQIHLS